jgi:hypothetical protein
MNETRAIAPERQEPASRLRRARRSLATIAGVLLALPLGHGQSSTDPSMGAGRTNFPDSQPSQRAFEPLPLFFPPNPPPLGRAIGRAPSPGRNVAPPELASYVNELFYPPLGTRLATKTLGEKLRGALERYRAAKVALQNELRAELDRVRPLDPETREQELAAFARRQTPKIVELEKNAEQFRRDLINSDNHWSALRQWHLGDRERRGFSPIEIAVVMRGYAFYHPGLLPAQRRLLREIFLELANAADSAANATAAQPYLFFPPEPARVLLPDDLPAEIAAKVAAYQTKKSRLKKELYDAVYAEDGKVFTFFRPSSLKALAEKQTAPLAELDRMAEEIRRDLARVVEPAAIAERSPLPPVLHHRLATLMDSYQSLQKAATAQIEAILDEAKSLSIQANYRFEPDGLKYIVIPARAGRGGASPETLAAVNAIRARIAAIADDYGRRIAELINEKDAIRTEVAQMMGTAKATAIDNALAAASRVVTAKATEDSYRDYRVAVFQPGLSPEQRRLFFDYVVERLELPLPRGEPQPTFRPSTW